MLYPLAAAALRLDPGACSSMRLRAMFPKAPAYPYSVSQPAATGSTIRHDLLGSPPGTDEPANSAQRLLLARGKRYKQGDKADAAPAFDARACIAALITV